MIIQVFKIGGGIINNKSLLKTSLNIFNKIKNKKVLIHGGGKYLNFFSKKLGIEQKLINGRRITDMKTLDIAKMIYAGLINKNLVAFLQSLNCNALGLSGVDGNLIKSKIRYNKKINYGYVGDLYEKSINNHLFKIFFKENIVPVICSLTHDNHGNILNTNADTIARYISISLYKEYKEKIHLHYAFEKHGVLSNINDDKSYLLKINENIFNHYINNKLINNGMIPKLNNAFKALKSGVSNVTIGRPYGLIDQKKVTTVCL